MDELGAKSKEVGTKDHVLCDYVYANCPEEVNP